MSKLSDAEKVSVCREVMGLVSGGMVVSKACKSLGTSDVTFWKWLDRFDLIDEYRKCQEIKIWQDVERIDAISGDRRRDAKCRQVEINAIQWKATKLLSKVFGDKQTVEATVTVDQLPSEDRIERLVQVAGRLPDDVWERMVSARGVKTIEVVSS